MPHFNIYLQEHLKNSDIQKIADTLSDYTLMIGGCGDNEIIDLHYQIFTLFRESENNFEWNSYMECFTYASKNLQPFTVEVYESKHDYKILKFKDGKVISNEKGYDPIGI